MVPSARSANASISASDGGRRSGMILLPLMTEVGMAERLVGAQRHTALHELHGWIEVDDRDAIRKTYHFENFSEAWAFVSRMALLAEKMDHHPELFNVYNRVEVILSTHDADGLSELDIRLAHAIDEIAPERDRSPPLKHPVLTQGRARRGIFGGAAEPTRERNAGGEALLDVLGQSL